MIKRIIQLSIGFALLWGTSESIELTKNCGLIENTFASEQTKFSQELK